MIGFLQVSRKRDDFLTSSIRNTYENLNLIDIWIINYKTKVQKREKENAIYRSGILFSLGMNEIETKLKYESIVHTYAHFLTNESDIYLFYFFCVKVKLLTFSQAVFVRP